jgi:hypothetical protein
MQQEVQKAIEAQLKAFRQKFGRDPRPGEPLIFDPDAPEPTPYPENRMVAELVEAMQKAGTPPEIIYAFKKTGLFLIESSPASPRDRNEWNNAIAEYFEMERKAREGREG